MENDPNPMPQFKLFTIREIGEKVLSLMTFLPSRVLSTHSDHFQHGAEAMLSAALDDRYEQLELKLGRCVFEGHMTAQEAYDTLGNV